MPRKPDLSLIGQTYNNLKVCKLTDSYNTYNDRLYECICLLCGNGSDDRYRLLCMSGGLLAVSRGQHRMEPTQPQRIADHKDTAETHSRCAEHGAEQQVECRIKNTGCQRNPQAVVKESPEQILLDVADHRLTKLNCRRYIQQVTFH